MELDAKEAALLIGALLADPDARPSDDELAGLQAAKGRYGGRLMSESKDYREGMRTLTRRSRPGEDVQYVGTIAERREGAIQDPDAQYNQFSAKTFVEMHRDPGEEAGKKP